MINDFQIALAQEETLDLLLAAPFTNHIPQPPAKSKAERKEIYLSYIQIIYISMYCIRSIKYVSRLALKSRHSHFFVQLFILNLWTSLGKLQHWPNKRRH